MAIEVFGNMLGKVMSEVVNDNNSELIFKSSDGKVFKFLHYQDCCEGVYIEDVCGDLNDLIGSPLIMAEEIDNVDPEKFNEEGYEYCQWTFYRFGTNKGFVTVRWFGQSNGYYGVSVSYEEVK